MKSREKVGDWLRAEVGSQGAASRAVTRPLSTRDVSALEEAVFLLDQQGQGSSVVRMA